MFPAHPSSNDRLKLRELGADIPVRTCLTEFILDEDGAVRGVQARGMGQPRHPEAGPESRLRTMKGVVLATGGFGADRIQERPGPTAGRGYRHHERPIATAER